MFAPSPAELRRVDRIQFGVLSPDDIVRLRGAGGEGVAESVVFARPFSLGGRGATAGGVNETKNAQHG